MKKKEIKNFLSLVKCKVIKNIYPHEIKAFLSVFAHQSSISENMEY